MGKIDIEMHIRKYLNRHKTESVEIKSGTVHFLGVIIVRVHNSGQFYTREFRGKKKKKKNIF